MIQGSNKATKSDISGLILERGRAQKRYSNTSEFDIVTFAGGSAAHESQRGLQHSDLTGLGAAPFDLLVLCLQD